MLVDQLTHAAAADLGRGGRSLGMPPLAAPGFTPAAMAPPAGDVAGVATTPATRAAARGAPLGVAQGGAAGAPALLQTGSLPAATAAPAAACSGVSCVPRNAAAPLIGAGVVADDAAVALAESREHGQLGLATNQTVCPRNTPAHDDARSLMRLCAHEQKTSPRQSLQFQRNWDQRIPSACRCWHIAPQLTRCMPRHRLRACPLALHRQQAPATCDLQACAWCELLGLRVCSNLLRVLCISEACMLSRCKYLQGSAANPLAGTLDVPFLFQRPGALRPADIQVRVRTCCCLVNAACRRLVN